MLKLGSQTGNLTNHILSRAVIGQPEPEEGMGATILAWTDRYPATVIMVIGKGKDVIAVREDDARRIDANGMSEIQQYEFTPAPQGRVWLFKRARSGAWRQAKETARGKVVFDAGYGLRLGERGKYHDFSF